MARGPTQSKQAAGQTTRSVAKVDAVFDVTERRHPRYNLFEKHWRFLLESYEGGPEYLLKGLTMAQVSGSNTTSNGVSHSNLFKYFKEGVDEFRDRMARAHRNNYSKKVVDQIRSFIARKPPARRVDAAPSDLQEFWKNTDGQGRKIDDEMMQILQWGAVMGIVWVHVDKPNEDFATSLEEREVGMPYVRLHFPFDVLDGGFDDKKNLKWIMVREAVRLDASPFAPSPVRDIYTIWDRQTSQSFRKNSDKDTMESRPFIAINEPVVHGLGFVPFTPFRFTDSEFPFLASGMIDDIAYLDRDIFNKQSQLDTIIYDQTFSQLAMPTDAIVLNDAERNEGGDGASIARSRQTVRDRLMEMGTKRVFLFNGKTAHAPAYISPDAEQAGTIRQVIADMINEVYRLSGLAGEVGRDVKTQSGVSKSYDFDKLNRTLSFAALQLQKTDRWIAQTARAWLAPIGETPSELPDDLIGYPENFDIMGLLELLDIAFRADELDLFSPTASAEMRKKVILRMFPSMPAPMLKEVISEIDDRLKREKTMAEKMPLDPFADPRADDDGNPSETRGAGGGAKPVGGGTPSKPTTQQANKAEGK